MELLITESLMKQVVAELMDATSSTLCIFAAAISGTVPPGQTIERIEQILQSLQQQNTPASPTTKEFLKRICATLDPGRDQH